MNLMTHMTLFPVIALTRAWSVDMEIGVTCVMITHGCRCALADAHGRGVAWVYYARTDALTSESLTREQAMKVAQAIARLSREP